MSALRMAIGALLVTIIASFALVAASQMKHTLHEELIDDVEKTLAESGHFPTTQAQEPVQDADLVISNGQVRVLRPDGRPKEIRYYRAQRLVILDNLDEGGKLLRRDVYEGERARVQLFYDPNGHLVRRCFLSEKGAIVSCGRQPGVFVPLGGGRTGY